VWLFVAFEGLLFAGLFSTYFILRAGAGAPWAPFTAHRTAAIVSTALLFGATASFAAAMRMAQARRIAAFRGWMVAASALAFLFLPYRFLQYVDAWEFGYHASTSAQWRMYFLLTGVHALHVAGGVLVDVWLLCTSTARWVGEAPAVINRVAASALYWYFVNAIWVVLFVLLYVV
jgi:heme/copper-type cytochrome/quinol oxidase subunit 3